MKAVIIDHGAQSHIKIADVEEPSPAPNEAVVRVAATSLNLGEVRYAQTKPLDSRIGWDLAGTVIKAAADGSGPAAGTRVVGFVMWKAWAEQVAVPTRALAAIPDNVSFAQAATLPVAGLTALLTVEKGTNIIGRRVLITGANGGVGLFSCQIASLAGANPVALIRREQYKELVESAGARDVVVSEDGSGAAEFGLYKLITDAVGGPVFANTIRMLSEEGTFVTYGTSAGVECVMDISTFYLAGRSKLEGFILLKEAELMPISADLSRLAGLVSEGKLKTFISVEEDWSKISQVAEDLWNRKIPGKAVLHIS